MVGAKLKWFFFPAAFIGVLLYKVGLNKLGSALLLSAISLEVSGDS